jgi:hypothetical protein
MAVHPVRGWWLEQVAGKERPIGTIGNALGHRSLSRRLVGVACSHSER